MSDASSNYTDARSTQSDSTGYLTALETGNPTSEGSPSVSTRSYSNDGVPSEAVGKRRSFIAPPRSIKTIERLRQEASFDPRCTDSKYPTSPSLLPRFEYVVRNRILKEQKAWREVARKAFEEMLGIYFEFGEENTMWTKHPSYFIEKRLGAKGIVFLGSEPRDAEDIRRLIARREDKQRVPMPQWIEQMNFLGSEFKHRHLQKHCPKRKWRWVARPPKEIAEKDFWDLEAPAQGAVAEDENDSPQQMGNLLGNAEISPIEISPDAPRSAKLDELVKIQSLAKRPSPHGIISRSLGVTREYYQGSSKKSVGSSSTTGMNWRPCNSEELIWIETMDQLKETEIEVKFWQRFGWRIPEDWVLLARNMHQDPMHYKKWYLGWSPSEVVAFPRKEFTGGAATFEATKFYYKKTA
jgi:hypothetical protein